MFILMCSTEALPFTLVPAIGNSQPLGQGLSRRLALFLCPCCHLSSLGPTMSCWSLTEFRCSSSSTHLETKLLICCFGSSLWKRTGCWAPVLSHLPCHPFFKEVICKLLLWALSSSTLPKASVIPFFHPSFTIKLMFVLP